MIIRDHHIVFRPNDIEDHDPGDHDDGIGKLLATLFAPSFERVINGTATTEDLIAFMDWELKEAMYSLPPMATGKEDQNDGSEPTRVTDTWHASACVARARSALRSIALVVQALRAETA